MLTPKPLWVSLDDAVKVEEVRALCAAGMSTEEVAGKIGVAPDTVTMLRLRHDIDAAHGRRVDIRLSTSRKSLIAEMTRAGCRDDDIAAALGVTSGTIRRHRGAYNLPSGATDLELSATKVAHLILMHEQGATQTLAATTLGIHKATIGRLFARLGRRWGSHNQGGRIDAVLRAEVIRLTKLDKKPSEIADAVHRSRSAITNLRKRLRAEGLI